MAVRHLLEVSAGLLGICLAFLLAASLTHSLLRRNHWNELDLQNVISHIYYTHYNTLFSYLSVGTVISVPLHML